MPTFLTRLFAKSNMRLNRKAYLDGPADQLVFRFPWAKVAVIDRFVAFGTESIPQGLLIQVELDAPDIDAAIDLAPGAAVPVLSLLSLSTGGSVEVPKPIWSFDVTPDAPEREWRYCSYDPRIAIATRRSNNLELLKVWNQLNAFMGRADIKEDFKRRVFNAVHAYRRAIADTGDSLQEFLTLWASLEGLDCVYHKALPSRNNKFMDGVRDVFDRLNASSAFATLQPLRHEVAHGNLSLQEAFQKANAHIELVRNAIQLMTMRIIGCDEETIASIIQLVSVKGKIATHIRLVGTIQTKLIDFADFAHQPEMEPIYGEASTQRNGDKLDFRPEIKFKMKAPDTTITVRGHELRGEKGGSLSFHGPTVVEVSTSKSIISDAPLTEGENDKPS